MMFETTIHDNTSVTVTNPMKNLEQAFEIVNTCIFSDELLYHVIVPRSTRAYKYGSTVRTHELPIKPAYYGSPEHVTAELIHQMWHVWQHAYGTPPSTDHKGHYHNAELQERLRQCGLQPVSDEFWLGVLPRDSYCIVTGSEADAVYQYLTQEGIIHAGIEATPLKVRHRSRYFRYRCPKCGYQLPKMQSCELHTEAQTGRMNFTCGKQECNGERLRFIPR